MRTRKKTSKKSAPAPVDIFNKYDFSKEKIEIWDHENEVKKILNKCVKKVMVPINKAIAKKNYGIAKIYANMLPASLQKAILVKKIDSAEELGHTKLTKY